MKVKLPYKSSAIFLTMILILVNFYVVNFGTLSGTPREPRVQPYLSFKQFNWGGIGERAEDKYGWNFTYIENLNGDAFPDLVIGTPWYGSPSFDDRGAIFIFYGSASSAFNNLNYSQADVTILGDDAGHKFGWDVANAHDMNNDGFDDIIVGAPGVLSNHGRAYIFYGGTLPTGTSTASNVANRILNGPTAGGYYGAAVAGVGDFNGDEYDDILVGAPAADQVIITYGYKNKVNIYPDLWDDNLSSPGLVDFSNGVNNYLNATYPDNNSWGLEGDDDGWDWIDSYHDPTRLYGQDASATIDDATIYAPWEPDGPDADGLTWGNRTALEIMIGRNHTAYNPYAFDASNWDPAASAAWGIEFKITPEDYSYLSTNSSITIGFDYGVMDANKIYNINNLSRYYNAFAIRSRLWNSSVSEYLGDVIVSSEKYIFYRGDPYNSPPWGPIYDNFEWDITKYISGAGSYYWDFGCHFNLGYGSRADDGMWAFFDNITMKIENGKSIVIEGMLNSGFGSAIAALGDVNGDGYPDAMIGAPYLDGGYAALLSGKKRFNTTELIGISNIILTGKNHGDMFGYSVASAGDVDNDGVADVIIGAPGGNYANLYYGSTLNAPLLVPDLWEADEDKSTPYVEFNSGLKSTGNTPGLSGADDGWDTWDGVYGFSGTAGSAVKYNGVDGISSQEIADDNELIIYIGGTLGGGGWYGAKPDSGAYGVEFSVTQEMINAIASGGEAVLLYDWHFRNSELDQDDTIWIKTYIRSNTKDHALGWSLDKDAIDNNNKDSSNETYWSNIPEDIDSVFIQKCSNCFLTQGSYYLDIGAKVRNWYYIGNGIYEDGAFHFDNLNLRINPPPDVKFVGSAESGFGHSVGYSDKLNVDNYGDIIIGAPYFDSPNGNDSGAIFGFIMGPNTNKIRFIEDSEFITYGEHPDDYFGWELLGALNLDSDDFNEVITSAINYDSPTQNIGRIYMYSISTGPRIRLLYPVGGELLSGNITVSATVFDPDENIDTGFGVRFLYSTDLNKWTIIGDDKTPPTIGNIYDHYWNTTMLPDGSNYYLKGWVKDLTLNSGENISSKISIDNPHPPELTITSPAIGEVIASKVNIKVLAKDSELDNIGGGINITRGVNFFFSKDKILWESLGSVHSCINDIYNLTLLTNVYPDGEYWIKVNASDLDGFEVEKIINISIDNPGRTPSITLLSPINATELIGMIELKATVFDFDGDVNSSGVSFYITPSKETVNWQYIGNDSEPELNNTGAEIYSIDWLTTSVPDNWYHLKAYVMDREGLSNESLSYDLKVHNNKSNPPFIKLVLPVGGEKLRETQILTAKVWDLEDNIDAHGVDYYFSTDKSQWRYIGTTASPRAGDSEYYDFLWKTNTVPDGEYWLNVSVYDTSNLKSWDISDDTVLIHNSNLNPPIINFVEPKQNQHINDTFNIRVAVIDLENNIKDDGVMFYYSTDKEDWEPLNNAPSPTVPGGVNFEFPWDTTKHPDGKYWLRAEVSDYDDLTGISISDYFFIHNNQQNPPIINFLGPHSGELKGIIRINATAFDLEKNINNDGIKFLYSSDNKTWHLINNDPTGKPEGEETYYYEITWDTTLVPDNIYRLRAEALDLTNLTGIDFSDGQVIVHNHLTNPPMIRFILPNKGVPLSILESIIVEVIDFDGDVESVSFYYSEDNETWDLIDTKYKPERDNLYKTVWNTEEVYNGKYYIKIIARDQLGNQAEIVEGLFEVKEGKEISKKADEGLLYLTFIIIFIIIVVILMSLIIFFILRRSKRREKELIEEVSAEMRGARVLDGEVVSTPELPGLGAGAIGAEPSQTYLPPLESQVPLPILPPALTTEYKKPEEQTPESYQAQMNTWKAEGYNISRLEQLFSTDQNLFSNAFPIFSSNISKLKEISRRLSSIDTTGYNAQVNSINKKLYNPDQASAAERELQNLEIELGLLPPTISGPSQFADAASLSTPTHELTSEPEQVDDILPQLLPDDTEGEPISDEPPKLHEEPDVTLPELEISLPEPEPEHIDSKKTKKASQRK